MIGGVGVPSDDPTVTRDIRRGCGAAQAAPGRFPYIWHCWNYHINLN